MTPEELEIRKCLDKVFAYCRAHEGSCEGCIFFKYVQIANFGMRSCRVMYAPLLFDEEDKHRDDNERE